MKQSHFDFLEGVHRKKVVALGEKIAVRCGLNDFDNQHTCRKCGGVKALERHHMFPKVHFGQGVRISLCAQCHKTLEFILQTLEGRRGGQRLERPKQFYIDVTIDYLIGKFDPKG